MMSSSGFKAVGNLPYFARAGPKIRGRVRITEAEAKKKSYR
eukprot:CAMPEP_0201534794 /NCGR_PEP_ID=MMETSP0161_2-20130828/57152_1 /ASSEMBLY_ACC=CAM_ASM_000251 /TAXON_ID=180227 /ORGANISM="Neoparamoeba aestuarina, Strain SoJaBio B1-5/56/2" /LENGTH=40 /DNA_ID= /DNA_START= /DNA_END= /DNA_ORIENTATION=